jgi:hypothetical protein
MLERELQGLVAVDEADPFVMYLYGLILTDRRVHTFKIAALALTEVYPLPKSGFVLCCALCT